MNASAPSKALEVSEKKKKSNKEFIIARSLHDKFCKFEAVFYKEESIKTIRLIAQLIDPQILNDADLPFKLNSLRWFLTENGREFIKKYEKRCALDEKIAALDFNNKNDNLQNSQLNQIAPEIISGHNTKHGEDREYKKEIKTISEFLG